jgi:hypothetical protein
MPRKGPKGGRKLRAHIRYHHPVGAPDPTVEHSHRRHVRGQHIADRIDINPLALERFAHDGRNFSAPVQINAAPSPPPDPTQIAEDDTSFVAVADHDVCNATLRRNTRAKRSTRPAGTRTRTRRSTC